MKLIVATAILFASALPSCRASDSDGRTRADLLSCLRNEMTRYLQYWERRLFEQFDRIPHDKVTWRPTPDTRSVGEVVLHIASQNYATAAMAGWPAPKGVDPKTFERANWNWAMTRAAVVGSFGHLRSAVAASRPSALDANVDFHGRPLPLREAIIKNTMHTAEHIGQLLAYARTVARVTSPTR